MGKNLNMVRMPLKPYQGKFIRVIGNLEKRQNDDQWLLTDVWHYDGEREYLCDHAWVNLCDSRSDSGFISSKMLAYIREQSRLNDIAMHGYHWNCAEDQYNRWKVGVSKKEIDTKYGHKVVVETKVKCYANYTKYGLGNIKEQKVYFVENAEMITWDDEARKLTITDTNIL